MRTEVRFYGQLADLADEAESSVPLGKSRSVKDLVESLGVPHPEIAVIVVDGEPVDFSHQILGGERVAVYPPFSELDVGPITTVSPPPIPPRFVADVHLGTLARRLRLLGFDTWYRTEAHDAELADVAVAERRILLTRDRGLLMRGVIDHGYCPRSQDPDEQLAEVVARYGLSDQIAPMTRCPACNQFLAAVPASDVAHRLPPRTREAFDEFAECEGCGQLYWSGAHQSALEEIVERASSGTTSDGPVSARR